MAARESRHVFFLKGHSEQPVSHVYAERSFGAARDPRNVFAERSFGAARDPRNVFAEIGRPSTFKFLSFFDTMFTLKLFLFAAAQHNDNPLFLS